MFSEYERNALRMAALMKINPVFVFTHDSIGLGEDGPTHQPIEQTATPAPDFRIWTYGVRAIPPNRWWHGRKR